MAVTLENLVEEGKGLAGSVEDMGYGIERIIPDKFSKWSSKCVIFLETNYHTSAVTKTFIEKSKLDSQMTNYKEMLGIIEGFYESI